MELDILTDKTDLNFFVDVVDLVDHIFPVCEVGLACFEA